MLHAIQRNVLWRAIPVAGIAGGTVFLILMWLLTPTLLDIEPTLVLRYFAALVMGEGVLVEDDTATLAIGLLVHYVLSLVFALVIAIVVHRWGLLVGIVGGAILGLSFYLINFYTMTTLFEWFFAINNTVLLVGHVVYGAVAGGVYEYLDRFDLPVQGGLTHAAE